MLLTTYEVLVYGTTLFGSTTSWVGIKKLNGLVVKLEIFKIIEIIFIINIRIGIDDCGKGVMFGGTTKIGSEGNT
jgi:hypothetical protein